MNILVMKKHLFSIGVYAELGRLPLLFNIIMSILKFTRHVVIDGNKIAYLTMKKE
jgi:hypothetical protein